MTPATVAYAVRLGDDALILSQRLGEWISRAPQLEEDVALANIALDLLGQARMLLSYAGELEGRGRAEDDFAYLRDEREFCNVQLVEQPVGDFAVTIARLLVFSTYQRELYDRLRDSGDPTLAAIAAKAVKEVSYHRDHATQWTLRLGDGTPQSHVSDAGRSRHGVGVRRRALRDGRGRAGLAGTGVAVDRTMLRPAWDAYVRDVLERATLSCRHRPVRRSRVGGKVCTARRWGTCWRRCSIWCGLIRGRVGECHDWRSGTTHRSAGL